MINNPTINNTRHNTYPFIKLFKIKLLFEIGLGEKNSISNLGENVIKIPIIKPKNPKKKTYKKLTVNIVFLSKSLPGSLTINV